ncbi:MAG: PKD domain-containing protein, partial [Bacteroidetes bacterium]|nr:PKD domain-containing protein [Bacteroidota bacterium]
SCTNITTTIGGYGIGIYGVDIHDYSNTSTGPNVEGDYVDRACRDIIYLKSDTGYFTTITTGSSYNEYVKIFIDFNNNGNLNDAGELVFDGPRQKTTHQDTIRIPANPTTNTLLRMRIMSDYDTIPANACDTLHYGQTEDYGVVIEQREAVAHFVIDTNRVCQNGKIVLTDSSSGSVYKRRWYVSQYGLLTFKSDSAGPITFTLPDTGWYYAELVLNDSQVYKRIDSIVYVQPNPTATLSVMSGSTLSCEGDNITFTNGGSPTGFITSTWYRSGSLISGANSTIFPISNLTVSDTGTYSSIVDWNGCTANAGSTYLYVNPEPSASFNSNKDSSCYINNDFIFTNTSTLSSGTFSSAWDLGDGSTSSATDVNHSYADTGTYAVRLVVRTPSNCTDTAWKTVKVQESPSAGFTANMFNQCFKGNSFSFTNNSSISSGTLTSNWIFGDGNSSTDTDPIHAYGTTGSFTVQLISSSGICSDTLTQTANVYVSPVADFSITAHEACGSDNSFDFTDNSSISTGTLANYDWDFDDGTTSFNANHTNKNLNGSGDFDIGLIVTSDQGCKDTITQTVTVAEKPVAGFTLTIGENCLNGNRLQVASTSTVGTGTISQFSWDYGDGTSTLGSNPVDKSYTAAGIYAIRLIVVTDGGCKDTVTQNTIIHPSPMANFDTVGGCVNEEFTFANTSTIIGGGLANFLWTFGDGKTSVDQSPLHVYAASGTYEVSLKVTTDQGCTDSILKKSGALILANPGADFSYERVSSSGTISEVQFTDLSSDAITWLWNLGPAGNSTQQNPMGTYLDSGTFGVTLWVENADGCSDSVTKSILIFPSSNFMVPNGFTPNGDGINEEFKPVGLGYMKEYRLTIYNRWGMMVFTTKNPQDAWDGKFNGEYVLPGLYLVTMEYLDLEGNRGRYDQMINVMR